MKWALIAVLTLGALGAWAMGLQAAGSLKADTAALPVPKVVMRPLPALSGSAVAVAVANKAAPPAAAVAAAPAPAAAAKEEADPPPLPKA